MTTDTDNLRLDESVVDRVKRFPVKELVRLVFPEHPVGSRYILRSPFRQDNTPSFSCFEGRFGYWMWKDHSTGEFGDNIAFYRKAYPSLSYVEAVDALALLTLGEHAVENPSLALPRTPVSVRPVPARRRRVEEPHESALRVVADYPLDDPRVPEHLRAYWRGRGISDDAIIGMNCRYIVFENTRRAGMPKVDPDSGLPLTDAVGNVITDDGRSDAIGLYNDIGGVTVRVPDAGVRRGFKGNIESSFITTILSDGSRPLAVVRYGGGGAVGAMRYDASARRLFAGERCWFDAVEPFAVNAACVVLSRYVGSELSERDSRCLCAVFNALNVPVVDSVVVVEGMFDGLSEREMNRSRRGFLAGRDLVVANSVSNLHWAVPFICRHSKAVLMLDNDLRSAAGQKAAAKLCRDIADFGNAAGSRTAVFDGTPMLGGYKDLNDALRASKGFEVRKPSWPSM